MNPELIPQPEPETEQQWLGNVKSRTLEINLDAPLSLADYREQVWIPYIKRLHNTSDLRQTG